MAGPLLAAVGPIQQAWQSSPLGQIANVPSQLSSEFISAMLTPVKREMHVRSNRIGRTITPPLDVLVKLYYAGRLTWAELSDGMLNHSIATGVGYQEPDQRKRAWYNYVDLARPMPDIERMVNWYRQDRVTPSRLVSAIRRRGFTDRSMIDLVKDSYENLDVGTLYRLLYRNLISPADCEPYLRALGFIRPVDQQLLLNSRFNPPAPGELLVMLNRDIITTGEADLYMQWLGFDNRESGYLQKLRFEIPGPSDLVRFSVREVWDQNVVDEFGYDNEFPVEFTYWMRKQGLDWTEDVTGPGGQVIPGVSWPRAYWRSHWNMISPSQSYEMLHRLRGNKADPATWRVPGVRPWDIDDVRRVLKVDDYPEPFRDRLAAISYRVPTRVDTRRMLENGIIDRAEATEIFQDQGYRQVDAERLGLFAEQLATNKRLKQYQTGHRNHVLHAYRIGSMSRQDAAIQIFMLGLPSLEGFTQFNALPRPDQLLLAEADVGVGLALDSVDLDQSAKLVDTAVQSIRKGYLKRELTQTQTEIALANLGITQVRITEYIQLWAWQFAGRGKTYTASQILRYVTRGAMPPAVALPRLMALGYSAVDAMGMLGVAMVDYGIAQARAAQAVAATQKQGIAAAKSLIREVRRLLRESQADLAKHGTPAQLQRWLKRKLIPLAEFRLRLGVLGWPQADISRAEAEALGS